MGEIKDVVKKSLNESKEDLKSIFSYFLEFGIKPISNYVSVFVMKLIFVFAVVLGATGFLIAHLLLLSDEYESFCKRISKFDVHVIPKGKS